MDTLRSALLLLILLFPAFLSIAPALGADEGKLVPTTSTPPQAKSIFDFEYYEDMLGPSIAEKEEERLCGLDKVCVTLWKKGKLQVYKDGRLFAGDFNQDGIPDEAVILEKDREEESAGKKEINLDKDYYIYITTKKHGVRKTLLHAQLPEAHNVIDVFWDEAKKALVIDTGGRVMKTESVSSFGGTSYSYRTGEVLKVVDIITWNPKTNNFDVIKPTYAKEKSTYARPTQVNDGK